MRIAVGCDLAESREYYRRLALDKEWMGPFGFTGELDTSWEKVLVEHPDLLLVWRDNDGIVGHAIWHETSTDEHREGDPRDIEDRAILRKPCGGKKENIVELHELWVRKKYRGKGYGKRFFEFFENLIRRKGYDSVVYYADHPAAIAMCRNRGWKEGFLAEHKWHVFCLSLRARVLGRYLWSSHVTLHSETSPSRTLAVHMLGPLSRGSLEQVE